LALKSAYSSLLGREPKHTNYTVGYVGVLDYIW
jgi:mRNA deadenylase 3'-5' endonuclease subunit Ccr4